jgi:hypothetical protein
VPTVPQPPLKVRESPPLVAWVAQAMRPPIRDAVQVVHSRPSPDPWKKYGKAEPTPFAEVPTTPESFVARVRRELNAACINRAVPSPELDRAAREAVEELWDPPVKAFIPVLALRVATARVLDHERLPTPVMDATRRAAAVPRHDGDADALLVDPDDDLVFPEP